MTKNLKNHLHILTLSGVLLASALFTFTSCASRPGKNSNTPEQTDLREVTDEAGRHIRIPKRIERIVSLAPNMTELIYAIGAGDLLVGNTTSCDFPPQAKDVQKVGDTLQPNIERIVALRAQLVFVSTASQLEAFTRQMEQQHIPIYITDPKDFDGVLRTIKTVGDLLGQGDQALAVVNDMRSRSDAVEAAVKSRKPVRVFYQVSREPLYTAGRDSFITDLVRRAGGISVTADVAGAWPKYSDESALASQPEAIIMASFDSMSKDGMEVAESLKGSPALKKQRVYGINGDYLSRPGPRLVNGLEEMARKLHPDAFK